MAASGKLDHSEHPFGYLSFNAKKYYKKVTVAVDCKVFKSDLKIFAKRQEEIMFNVVKRFKNYFQYGDYAPAHIYDKRTKRNPIGLYQIIGNVAELVSAPGIAKGGSWSHYLEESEITDRIPYSKPEPWLGFRCVCEVIPTK